MDRPTSGSWGALLLVALSACSGNVVRRDEAASGGELPSDPAPLDDAPDDTSCRPVQCSEVDTCGVIDDGCGGVRSCDCARASCSQSRPAGFAVDDPTIGNRAWDDAANVLLSDNQPAEISAMIEGDVSHYLRVTGFGFSVPPESSVLGIGFTVDRASLVADSVGYDSFIADHSVRLVADDQVVGKNHAASEPWLGPVLYGGPTDVWGEAWPASRVNGAHFGAALAAAYMMTAGNDWPRIDYVEMTIWYTCD